MYFRLGILALGLFAFSTSTVCASGNDSGSSLSQQQSAPLPAFVQQALASGNYAAVQEHLISTLQSREIKPTDEPVLNMTMLLELIRATGADVMTQFAAETKDKKRFLSEFAQDPAWQELYLSCGLVPYRTNVGIDVLYRIWQSEQGHVNNKPLAVALASVWGGGETWKKPAIQKKDPVRYNPVWRYHFFQKQAAKGALHPNYPNLQPWELRFVVGIPGQDWDDQSFAWAAEHINLPWDRYTWACWAATYTDPSKFGDSVQSGEYLLPYSSMSSAEATQRNGGVCGSLSHLGAYAAMAHGIPAYTVGQPGHCAYGVRTERGKWEGGFGGPDGGMHNFIFGDRAPTSYTLMETVFADDDTIRKAYRQSFCARALEATGNKKAAIKAWQSALEASPLHPFFRTELHRLMLEQGLSADDCYAYLCQVLPIYKGNGFAAADMMKELKEPLATMSGQQRLTLYQLLHDAIVVTPASWAVKCGDLLDEQSASLGNDSLQADFLSYVLSAHMNQGTGTTFGQVLEWAVKKYVSGGNVGVFSQAFAKAAAAAPAERPSTTPDDKAIAQKEKAMKEAYGKAIFATEEARSIPAFQALSNAAQKAFGSCPEVQTLPSPAELAGHPAPATGLLRVSTTSSWDAPIYHQGILTLQGGRCHTSREATPSLIAELESPQQLTGCIIRKHGAHDYRMKKATVYTSSDGATWMKKAETANMPKVWVVNFPEGTSGKWVKVEFDNSASPEFAHVSHFVIYVK